MYDRSLSPLGWFNVATSYFEAAKRLTESDTKLTFDDPIRGLYAHGWELVLKACLRRQGMTVPQIRKDYGHDLEKLWAAVDRDRFPYLTLRDRLEHLMTHLNFYHQNRLYAYPLRGVRRDVSLTYLRASTDRFKLSRDQVIDTFGSP